MPAHTCTHTHAQVHTHRAHLGLPPAILCVHARAPTHMQRTLNSHLSSVPACRSSMACLPTAALARRASVPVTTRSKCWGRWLMTLNAACTHAPVSPAREHARARVPKWSCRSACARESVNRCGSVRTHARGCRAAEDGQRRNNMSYVVALITDQWQQRMASGWATCPMLLPWSQTDGSREEARLSEHMQLQTSSVSRPCGAQAWLAAVALCSSTEPWRVCGQAGSLTRDLEAGCCGQSGQAGPFTRQANSVPWAERSGQRIARAQHAWVD